MSKAMDEAAIRESVVRECYSAIPTRSYSEQYKNNPSMPEFADGYTAAIDDCRRAIEALLPTKDRAEELAEEFCAATYEYGGMPKTKDLYAKAFRWLIEREG